MSVDNWLDPIGPLDHSSNPPPRRPRNGHLREQQQPNGNSNCRPTEELLDADHLFPLGNMQHFQEGFNLHSQTLFWTIVIGFVDQVDEATFDEMTDTNWKGAFFTIQKALTLMGEGGSIQLISSCANLKGLPAFTVYSGTKAAVRSLARCLAAELAPKGIRVNCLSPGCIETPVWTRTGVPADQVDGVKESMIPMIPMERFGEPDEVASVALFLASEESSYVTGANIAADGGFAQV